MNVSELVGEIEGVRRRTRRAARGGAVPLGILALLVLGAAPVYAVASQSVVDGDGTGVFLFDPAADTFRVTYFERLLNAHPNVTGHPGIGLYWLIAAPLAFAAIAAYYTWRARRTGIATNGWWVAAAGASLLALLIATMWHAGGAMTHDFDTGGPRPVDYVNPFLVVAVSVFVLAWVERSVAVLLAAVTFLGCLLLADTYSYATLSNVGFEDLASWGTATAILGAVLLLGTGVVAFVRRGGE
jgi:hypothetical protein